MELGDWGIKSYAHQPIRVGTNATNVGMHAFEKLTATISNPLNDVYEST